MLLGVITLNAKPKYRIETWVYNGERYFLPQQKVWYRTNYFPLPFKVWKSGSYPFQNKESAENIIRNWQESHQAKIDYKQSEFININ